MDLGEPKSNPNIYRLFLYKRVYWITRTPAFVWVGLGCICWTVSSIPDQCDMYKSSVRWKLTQPYIRAGAFAEGILTAHWRQAFKVLNIFSGIWFDRTWLKCSQISTLFWFKAILFIRPKMKHDNPSYVIQTKLKSYKINCTKEGLEKLPLGLVRYIVKMYASVSMLSFQI